MALGHLQLNSGSLSLPHGNPRSLPCSPYWLPHSFDGPHQADGSQEYGRQGAPQAAGHQGGPQVAAGDRRGEEAASVPPRDRGAARDPALPEVHRAADPSPAVPAPGAGDRAGVQGGPAVPELRGASHPGGRGGVPGGPVRRCGARPPLAPSVSHSPRGRGDACTHPLPLARTVPVPGRPQMFPKPRRCSVGDPAHLLAYRLSVLAFLSFPPQNKTKQTPKTVFRKPTEIFLRSHGHSLVSPSTMDRVL